MPFSGGDLPERMTFINGGFGYLGSPLVDESSNKKTYLAQHESTLYKVNCETGGVTNLGSNLSHEGANTIVGISNNYALGSVYGGVASHIVSLVDGSVVSRSAKCPGCDPRATYSFFLLPKDYLLFRTENRLMMKKLTSANFTEMWETSASLVYEITDDRTHSFYVDRGFYINRDDGYVVLSDRINSAADGKLYLFPLTIDDFDLMPIGPADRTCTGAIGYAGSLSGRFVSFRCMDLGMPTEQNPRIYLYNINTSRTIDLSSIIGITEPIELWNVQILESSTTGPKVFIPVQEDYQRARAFLVDVTSETSREITF